jgi:hypothetical protein
MPAYNLYVTIDHHGECTKAKLVYTIAGDQAVIHSVAEPYYLSPPACISELLYAVDQHRQVVREARLDLAIIKDDDAG